MKTVYGASMVSLHVRKTNRAALALYKDTLGFEVVKIEKGYCASILSHSLSVVGVLLTLSPSRSCRPGRRGAPVSPFLVHGPPSLTTFLSLSRAQDAYSMRLLL